MARFPFTLHSAAEHEVGVVVSDSFDEAMVMVTRRHRPNRGDQLEIGVEGFPPARYEHTGFAAGVRGWRPAGLLAA